MKKGKRSPSKTEKASSRRQITENNAEQTAIEPEEPFFVKGYTRLPPAEIDYNDIGRTQLLVSELDLPIEVMAGLTTKLIGFRSEENKPIYALEAFILAMENDLHPPFWVLDYLKSIFIKFHSSQGKESLDHLFGFGLNKGKPTGKMFKALLLEELQVKLCMDVYKLNMLYGFSVAEAAEKVQRKLEETKDWNQTVFTFRYKSQGDSLSAPAPGAEWIADLYMRKYKKMFKSSHDLFLKQFNEKTKEEKAAYLRTFPTDKIE